ncbi:MAG: MFS transporter [Sphingobium sp.]|nr:MFS transporter [Sphingobium sp.]
MQIQQSLRDQPMTRYQIAIVAMCVAINILDGFDILSIAFASPALAREWGLSSQQLGFLLSSGLVGISIGVLFFSFLADKIGRRPVILTSLVIMSAGMIACGFAGNAHWLALCRVLTGLGIGGMTATGGALAIEYSSVRRRTLAVALVVIGYPVGATLGGVVAMGLLEMFGWRSVFWFGGALSLLLLPVLIVWLPESIDLLLKKRDAGALDKVNLYLRRMGKAAVSNLPRIEGNETRQPVSALITHFGKTTFLLACAYAGFMFSFYFIINWATKLVTEMGLPDHAGVTASIMINLAGILGGLIVGILSARLSLSRLVGGVLLLMGAAIAPFGLLPPQIFALYGASFILGFFMWAGSALAYNVIALSYPAEIRATGIGLIVTIGRIGSILGPYTAGVMLGAGMSRAMVTLLLALPVMIAALLFAQVARTRRALG